MQRFHFEREIDRLKRVYGNNKYPQERIDLYWAKFKHIDHERFKLAITKIILYEQYAPMFDKFENEFPECSRESSNYRIEKIIEQGFNCVICKNTGRYVKQSSGGYDYAFRCDCKIGEFYTSIPKLERGHMPAAEKLEKIYPRKPKEN